MSRADELYTFAHQFTYGTATCCTAGPAKRIIHDLEFALAQRDERIAELELDVRQFQAAFKSARAEVPEWCKQIVDMCHNWERSGGYQEDACALAYLDKLIKALTPDQLRSCGIYVP
jgi:hypothetical protein